MFIQDHSIQADKQTNGANYRTNFKKQPKLKKNSYQSEN